MCSVISIVSSNLNWVVEFIIFSQLLLLLLDFLNKLLDDFQKKFLEDFQKKKLGEDYQKELLEDCLKALQEMNETFGAFLEVAPTRFLEEAPGGSGNSEKKNQKTILTEIQQKFLEKSKNEGMDNIHKEVLQASQKELLLES